MKAKGDPGREPVPLPGLLAVLTSYAALYATGAGDAAVTGVGVLALVAVALHGTLDVPRSLVLPALLPPLLVFFYQPGQIPEGSHFVGPGSYHVALYVGLASLLLIVRRNEPTGKLMLGAASTTLLIASGMRADGDRTFAALAALQAVCLALCYRELRQRTPRRNWLGVLLAFLPCLALAGGIGFFLRWVDGTTNDWVNFLDPVIPLSANFATRSKLTAM
ncbi:MAG: hypothetical protein AB1758_30325, partial [Candidatus Eremiobacterota bacterium]